MIVWLSNESPLVNTTSGGNRRDHTNADTWCTVRCTVRHFALWLFYAYGAIQFLVCYFPVLLVFRVPFQLVVTLCATEFDHCQLRFPYNFLLTVCWGCSEGGRGWTPWHQRTSIPYIVN